MPSRIRSPRSIAWSPDGRTLYATADDLGQRALFAIDVASGEVTTVVKDGTVRGFARAADTIVYGLDHLRSPVELYSVRPDGSGARVATSSIIAMVGAAIAPAALLGLPYLSADAGGSRRELDSAFRKAVSGGSPRASAAICAAMKVSPAPVGSSTSSSSQKPSCQPPLAAAVAA